MGDEAAGWLEKEKALLSPALPGFVFHRDFVSRLDEDIQALPAYEYCEDL